MTPRQAAVAPLHVDWSTIPIERIADGIERQMVWGERLMMCRMRFRPGVAAPVHSHPHEQMTIVERGRVVFAVQGDRRLVSAGQVLCFPSHCEHGVTILDEEAVLIDVFSPIREDFLPPGGE